MSVDVVVVRVTGRTKKNGRGELVYLGKYLHDNNAFEQACDGITDLPLIARVKPYDSLILEPDQMDQFIHELALLVGDRPSDFLEPLIELARLCARTEGSEMHLDGD